MYLTPTNSHWACDIEADNLLDKATRIWCATLLNVITKEKVECRQADEFIAFTKGHPDAIYVGHNFLSYDVVMLNRHWGAGIPAARVVDTFILSQIYNPTYTGGHSLKAWGERLKYLKGEFNEFDRFSEKMLRYCMRDTTLTALLFLRLTERMRQVGFTEDGCKIEHLAWNIIQNKQRRTGFPFNYKGGLELYVTLRNREEELQNEIHRLWPPELRLIRTYKSAYRKNGEYNLQYLRHKGQYPKLDLLPDGQYQAFDFVSFNLGSPVQRIEKLLELGWRPVEYTKSGNPKVDEDALLAFAELSGTPEVKALAKWIVINSRANMIRTWLDAYNEETGAIHGKLFIASTLRYRHNSPNSANIPAVRHKKDENGDDQIQYGEEGSYTYEVRDLWTCGDDGTAWSLVGLDGTGIQNRALIHNLIKTVGIDTVRPFLDLGLSGDIHRHNIKVLGLANKAAAKKFYYTLMMGGGGARLAADQAQFGTVMTAKYGDELKYKMIGSIPGFHELIAALCYELRGTGRIKLCDGTPILVSSAHMVIPYLLQGDESRLMKQAMIYVDEEINRHRLRNHVFKVADIHDEWQYRVRNEYVGQFTSLALPCFRRSGEHFNYNLPIDGDAKVGKTWAETH